VSESERDVRDWLRAFAAAVRSRDYAAGRALFAPDVRGFGSVAVLADGLEALEAEQWRRVWDATEGFDFHAGSVAIRVSGDLALATALWSSTGIDPDRKPYPRAGRATLVLARGASGWRAVHSHFSFEPEAPADRSP
jgi:ketosteroid isomerase-like protein